MSCIYEHTQSQSMPKHLHHRINTDLGARALHDIPQFKVSNLRPTSRHDDVVFEDDELSDDEKTKTADMNRPKKVIHAQTGDVKPDFALRHQFFNELVAILRPLSVAPGDVLDR